ncbi:LysR family transcriptional regulator [Brevibacterium permense]|uniref:LysR family transcriptional regulator n=1 Tax=Brevibacterium permense TaxID=234834 RepID=UPI0021D1FB5B|nr:LysR family transcriptional regulator [Brevibacterium permense]MCU4298234.1 LysR family transcriptional regulator [Brevibacterium permense]
MVAPPLNSRLDLNLIVALDALLTERNVTRAAESLGLSQPALSASLAKLRRHFNDPLLVRNGNSSELTPLARRLSAHVPAALDSFRRVFESQSEWAPETSEREFRIYGSDYAFATVGQAASRIAHQSAPGVKFRFELHTPSIVEDSAQLRASDGILIPHGHVEGLRHTDLWTDDWLVLVDAAHPTIQGSVTLEDLHENPWVFTYQSPSAFTSANKQLETMGIEPRVDTIVASFLALPHFIRGTSRLGMVQAGFARGAEHRSGLQVLRPPFDAAPVANALWWHAIHENDPEHEWMRGVFSRAGEELARAAESGSSERDR